MHPIERLRLVAREEGGGPSRLTREAAGALAGFAGEPAALVTACHRLVERHPSVGPVWWLASRVIASLDPQAECRALAERLGEDPTPSALASELPNDLMAVLVGWPELAVEAIRTRGDLELLVVESAGEGSSLARRLRSGGSDVHEIPDGGLASAVLRADLVLLEAWAVGPDGAVAAAGSRAAASVGRLSDVAVWMVAGVGRVLPAQLWSTLCRHLEESPCEPWERLEEIVPLKLVDRIAGPAGLEDPLTAAGATDCPVVAELARPFG